MAARSSFLPNDVALLQELNWFEIKQGPTGAVKYEAAIGQKDDLICAVALAPSGCGGVVRQESFASLGLHPVSQGQRTRFVGPDGRAIFAGPLEDGFPMGSWEPWLR